MYELGYEQCTLELLCDCLGGRGGAFPWEGGTRGGRPAGAVRVCSPWSGSWYSDSSGIGTEDIL